MVEHRYRTVTYPWRAVVEVGPGQPTASLARLMQQTARYGMPARRFGALPARLLRATGLPSGAVRALLRLAPRGARPDLDDLRIRLLHRWGELRGALPGLPERPPRLGLLALERSAARTVFVFGDNPTPLVMCKFPRHHPEVLEREAAALHAASPCGLAPRYAGAFDGAFIQEGLRGEPLALRPIDRRDAARLAATDQLMELWSGLERLAASTARRGTAEGRGRQALERARGFAPLSRRAVEAIDSAIDATGQPSTVVLQHGDVSAQNALFDRDRLVGLVDWEYATPEGLPGIDTLNAALAYLEHGIGLRRWGADIVVESFRAAWQRSELFERAREAAAAATRTAGIDPSSIPLIEVIFFARRLGRRMDNDRYATGPHVAAAMLECVCGS